MLILLLYILLLFKIILVFKLKILKEFSLMLNIFVEISSKFVITLIMFDLILLEF